jgi:hypothetical protein
MEIQQGIGIVEYMYSNYTFQVILKCFDPYTDLKFNTNMSGMAAPTKYKCVVKYWYC